MKSFIIVAVALGGCFILGRKRAESRQPIQLPLTTRQYHDRLANRLEAALSYGHEPMWDEVSAECCEAGRGDLPEHMREKWPEWAERIDRA